MLTIDDANTIIKKYGDDGFWYHIDLGQFDLSNLPRDGRSISFYQDHFRIQFLIDNSQTTNKLRVRIYLNNIYCKGLCYNTYNDGTLYPIQMENIGDLVAYFEETSFKENPPIFHTYISANSPQSSYENRYMSSLLFVPLQSTIIPINNGTYNEKFYITPIGDSIDYYIIDGEQVSLEEDDTGKFLRLPPHSCTIGVHGRNRNHNFYNIVFRESKTLPPLNILTLYRGTPQTITITNESTGEPITDFQAYYQGMLLKDNIITLPYDAPDIIDITVDLFESEYPESTIKLKANTELKLCTSVAQITNAIEQGIQTLQVHRLPNGTITLNGLTFENITFIDSRIMFRECILNNVTITQTEEYNGEISLMKKTVLNNCTLQNLKTLRISICELNNCTLKEINSVEAFNYPGSHELVMTGTITDCTLKAIIVFSDGDITLTNNNFTKKSSKEHFPNFLYLTGNYTVTNNTFTLNDEWEELAFNMCIIKADNTFNPSAFINNNTLNLNIVYGEESPNTFYYNIIDDDKIRAVRLE